MQAPSTPESNFSYRGCRFACTTQRTGANIYVARVQHLQGLGDLEGYELPQDADPYSTEAEALRHAEQQAIRWVNDRTRDGRGQS